METVVVEHHNAVRRIILNRPSRRNAQNFLMWRELDEVGARISNDPNVRCVVITGLENFSSGIDLAEVAPPDGALISIGHLARTDMAAATKKLADIQSQFLWITESHLPVVAAVRGVALGAGLELALACDLRLADDSALFRMPGAQLGLGYTLSAIEMFVQRIGQAATAEIMFAGRAFGAADISVVNESMLPRAVNFQKLCLNPEWLMLDIQGFIRARACCA